MIQRLTTKKEFLKKYNLPSKPDCKENCLSLIPGVKPWPLAPSHKISQPQVMLLLSCRGLAVGLQLGNLVQMWR